MFESIKNFLGTGFDNNAKKALIDAGQCPNCWGHQEFDNKFKEVTADKTKANLNMDEKKTFISQFVETHIEGVRLQAEGDAFRCPTCKTGYKVVAKQPS